MSKTAWCDSPYRFSRRETREVRVGDIGIGGANPVRIQSMITADTMDTAACVRETAELAAAGCEIVRITAPTVKDAANLGEIRRRLREAGCRVPLVADIHFKPEAAMEAALHVEKVRVNPGNYADKKKFAVREYTDEEYAAEIGRIREKFAPLVRLCKERGVAMRIGTNHGSLSDRIMNRYGDTPLGMVESALEFARIARDLGYHDFVFSMKASNPKVMVAAYRLLAARLRDAGPGWNYPLHVGVTEAGDGEDGRIKSAVGIGSLLLDGIGDTVRVSLTEDSVREIPVARALVETAAEETSRFFDLADAPALPFDPFSYSRRPSETVLAGGVPVGGTAPVRVCAPQSSALSAGASGGPFAAEFLYETCGVLEIDPLDAAAIGALNASPSPKLVTVADGLPLPVVPAFRLLAARADARHPILLKDTLLPGEATRAGRSGDPALRALLRASANIGSLLCDGLGDAVLVRGEPSPQAALRLSYNILQAAGARVFKTDFVACPSCGRTLFNLQETTAKIRQATGHLKGVRIAVMGCIVNGPGEMADADFGYVGGAPGKVNLYVGKTPVKFNVPEEEAVGRLVELIKEKGKWAEPSG